jgi:hypothetical protein
MAFTLIPKALRLLAQVMPGVMFLMIDICDMFETKDEIKGKFKCLLEFHHCGGQF